jgi:glycerol-3-phosphate dehydrogenase (NAD(P)+)
MRIGVLGGGSFGTALAKLLAELDHDVVLWAHNPEHAASMAARRENVTYLPGFELPENLVVTASLPDAVADQELLVAASPSHVLREVVLQARPHVFGRPYLVSAVKGIEAGSLKRMSEVLMDVFGPELASRTAALSGPSFACEVAAGMPTAVTVAASVPATADTIQAVFRGPTFRVYTTTDIVGVEIGGAVKNVIAIAAGVSDGLGLGSSSRAALITRGVAEVARLAARLGGNPQTVSGLSGVGDMVLTCTGDLSRNRTLGFRIARGDTLQEVLAETTMVVEGVRNSVSVCALARRVGVEMPIAEQMRLMLHEGKPAYQVVGDLLSRRARPEFWT